MSVIATTRSLTPLARELVAQWHPVRNEVSAEARSASSNKKAWWLCDTGHEWEAVIAARTKGSGCPYCSGRLAIPGKTDLTTTHPEIAVQWHPTKNGDALPVTVRAGSNKKAWWQCDLASCAHEWQAVIASRALNGASCPGCSGRAVVPGVTDLASVYPEIAVQWHPTKNGTLLPHLLRAGSDLKIWWQCEDGHEWQTRIANRTAGVGATGCPYCSERKAVTGENDLMTLHPELMEEWDVELNKGLDPAALRPGADRKAWWKCKEGHSWKALIRTRTISGAGCPYCAGIIPVAGVNDLMTVNPSLASQWHPSRNGDWGPHEVLPMSNKRAWWVCDAGHEWETVISGRSHGKGCPFCSGSLLIVGTNDLTNLHPEIALDWHPTRNVGVGVETLHSNSNIKVWWRCSEDAAHEWRTSVAHRTRGSGCPYCAGRVSRIELMMRSILSSLGTDVTDEPGSTDFRWSALGRLMKFDLVVGMDAKTVIIEYDGKHWHKSDVSVVRDTEKTLTPLADPCVWVVRIRENGLPFLPITHDRLLQLNYRNEGTPANKMIAMHSLKESVIDWLDSFNSD